MQAGPGPGSLSSITTPRPVLPHRCSCGDTPGGAGSPAPEARPRGGSRGRGARRAVPNPSGWHTPGSTEPVLRHSPWVQVRGGYLGLPHGGLMAGTALKDGQGERPRASDRVLGRAGSQRGKGRGVLRGVLAKAQWVRRVRAHGWPRRKAHPSQRQVPRLAPSPPRRKPTMGTEATLEGTTGSVGAFNPTLWAPSCAPLPHRAGEAVPGEE